MTGVLVSVLEFQHDMISKNTRESVAAAEAIPSADPPPSTPQQPGDVVDAFRDAASVKALARQHRVAPKTIRRVPDAASARSVPDRFELVQLTCDEPRPHAQTRSGSTRR